MEEKMLKNIRLAYVLKGLTSSLLMIAILVPFFNERGLNQFQITALQAAFAITVLFVEVPSGYLADKLGRKQTMMVGAALGFVAMAMYAVVSTFWLFLIVEVLLGSALAMFSGADDALAYDSFVALGKKSKYKQFKADSMFYAGFFTIIASVFGGWLGSIDLRYPFYGQMFVEIGIIITVLLMVEPERVKERTSKHPIKEIASIAKYSLSGHPRIKWLILYTATLSTMTHTVVWLVQPAYAQAGVALHWYGWLWASSILVTSVSAKKALVFEGLLGKRNALVSLSLVGPIAYILLGWSIALATLPLMYVFNFIHGVSQPILSSYMNELVDSDIRATVLSVGSMMKNILYSGLVVAVGSITDAYSLQAAMTFSGVVYGFLGLAVVALMLRKKQI